MTHLVQRQFMALTVTLCLILWTNSVCAASSFDTRPDLRALFVEAPDEVRVKTIHNMPPHPRDKKIYWLDNHRLIYTVRQINDWQAKKEERSKIIIFDVDTGKVEETPYRGDLKCFGPEGQMLVQDYPVPLPAYLLPGDTKQDAQVYLSGNLGDTLTRFKRDMEHGGVLDPYACQFYNNHEHGFGPDYMLIRLRRSDGNQYISPLAHPDSKLYMVSPEGINLWSIEDDKLCTHRGGRYLPWLNRYFFGVSWGNVAPGCMDLNKNSLLFSTQGVELKPLPKLIQEIRRPGRHVGGYGAAYWARPGMYVTVQFSDGFDGLYWQDEKSGQLKRVLKNSWGLDILSPDGCRNLVTVNPYVILELCNGDQQ